MKFVVLGKVSVEGANKYKERGKRAAAKAKSLGIEVGWMYYTQGPYDIVELLDAPSPEVMLAHTLWYKKQGYGELVAYPVFDREALIEAEKQASKKP
jgi:uncharacterized protein with GYD domain